MELSRQGVSMVLTWIVIKVDTQETGTSLCSGALPACLSHGLGAFRAPSSLT